MTTFSFSLVILAALVHAGWNFWAKTSGGDIRFVLLMSVAVAVIWAPIGLPAAWNEWGAYGALQWGLIAASAVLHVVYHLALLRGYRQGELTVVYPLARGTAPLVTAVAASFVLSENLGLLGWAGVCGIVGGIIFVAGGPALLRTLMNSRSGTVSAEDIARLKSGLVYGVLSGLFIAAYSVVDGYAVKQARMSPLGLEYVSTLVRVPVAALLLLAMRRNERLSMGGYFKRLWRPVLIVGALSPVSYVLMLYAATLAPLSQVAPAREVSMLFAALFAGTLLGERSSKSRMAGAGLIAGGVAALAFA